MTLHWKIHVLRLLIADVVGINKIVYLVAYAATHHSLPDRPTLGAPKPINRQDGGLRPHLLYPTHHHR